MSKNSTTQKLALLGGKPIRKSPFKRWPIFGKAEEVQLLRTLRSGNWGRLQGEEVATFEKRFAEAHDCKHGVAVTNGTVSLRIALLAAGIKAEDEVIVPPYTFFSTASAVIEANAVPVFVDVDLQTFNLDPLLIEKAITRRTRAIIPVHFAGLPAAMDAIMRIAKNRNLIVIEDAAHAHGAIYKAQKAGSIGHLGSFLSSPAKISLPEKVELLRRMMTTWLKFAAQSTVVDEFRRAPGTNIISFREIIVWANFRAQF